MTNRLGHVIYLEVFIRLKLNLIMQELDSTEANNLCILDSNLASRFTTSTTQIGLDLE